MRSLNPLPKPISPNALANQTVIRKISFLLCEISSKHTDRGEILNRKGQVFLRIWVHYKDGKPVFHYSDRDYIHDLESIVTKAIQIYLDNNLEV